MTEGMYVYVFLLREYFLQASTVGCPEETLGIDEYSEVTRLTKPVIYISVKEVCSTHAVRHTTDHVIFHNITCSLQFILCPKPEK